MYQNLVMILPLVLGQLVSGLPEILPKGEHDFTVEGVVSKPTLKRLERRDGEVVTSGVTASWTVGGQNLTGLLDAGAGYLTTRNVSQYSGPGDTAGYYEISNSSTVTLIGDAQWSECFNDGCFGGQVVKDNVVMSGGSVTADQALIFTCNSSCQGSGSNFGMGRGLTTTYQENGQDVTGPSFFGSISGNLTQPLWTLLLANGTGKFDFGYIDSSKYSGDVGYLDVDTTGNWAANVTGYSFSDDGGSSTTEVLRFALDTGDSEMGLPPDIVSTYFGAVSGSTQDSSGNWDFPCDATLPDFTISVGGVDVTVDGSNFKGGENSDGTCWSSLVPGGSGDDANTWGLPFLQGVFTVFSYASGSEPDRIGFANYPS